MNQQKSIIPEFMINNPNDTFKFLFPLRLKLDHSNYANSHFEVIVKTNISIILFYSRINLIIRFLSIVFNLVCIAVKYLL